MKIWINIKNTNKQNKVYIELNNIIKKIKNKMKKFVFNQLVVEYIK